MSKLDDVSWHFSSDEFPSDLPEENAATHIGFFVAWIIRNDYWGSSLAENANTKIAAVREGRLSARRLILEECDGKFFTDMLKVEIVPFVQSYYDKNYLYDYRRSLLAGLASEYLVEDNEENFMKIASFIDHGYAAWLKKTKRPRWKIW